MPMCVLVCLCSASGLFSNSSAGTHSPIGELEASKCDLIGVRRISTEHVFILEYLTAKKYALVRHFLLANVILH